MLQNSRQEQCASPSMIVATPHTLHSKPQAVTIVAAVTGNWLTASEFHFCSAQRWPEHTV
jgi:hypothetical protein